MSIKDLRKQSGMTQKRFCEYFGIPHRTLQNWEAGIRECPEYLERLIAEKVQAMSASSDQTVQQAIELLQSGRELSGMHAIEEFVWSNTAEPKYKEGDAVLADLGWVIPHRGREYVAHNVPFRVKRVMRHSRERRFKYALAATMVWADGQVEELSLGMYEQEMPAETVAWREITERDLIDWNEWKAAQGQK